MSKSRALVFVVVGYALAVALAHLVPPLPPSLQQTAIGKIYNFVFILAAGDEEDRPLIIVRGGSIHIDDGDKNNQVPAWKPWMLSSPPSFSLHLWKPDHPKGAPVFALQFTAKNVTNSADCPTTPTNADSIDLNYSEAQVFNLSIMKSGGKGGKAEPVITTTLNLSETPGLGKAPDQLSYTEGTLTGFTAHAGSTQVANCTFATTPATDERLRVQPIRHP